MKKVLTNYRYYVLFIIAGIAVLGIFSEPNENLPEIDWLFVLLCTKAVGFGAMYIFHRLFTRWEKRGTIPELTQFTNDF